MAAFVDLTGKRFDRLLVIDRTSDIVDGSGRARVSWNCLCDCGETITTRGFSLTCGHTKSCGCIKKELIRQLAINKRIPLEQKINNKRKKSRECHYKDKFGISIEELNNMIAKQNNKCSICECELEKPCVDHCHYSGKIREILCVRCNFLLGYAKDDIKILESAIRYVKKHE